MANAAAYEASSLDWEALGALAKRAAQETPLPPDPRIVYFDRKTNTNVDLLGPHWVLDHRFENFDDRRHAYPEEEHDELIYALLPDGELMYVQIRETCTVYSYGNKYEDDHTVRRMNESDVLVFDYTTKYYEYGFETDCHVWGTCDRERGDLLQDAKGAGLSRLLEAVRTGEAKLPPGPSQFHTAKAPPKPRAETSQPATVATSSVSANSRSEGDFLATLAAGALAITVLVPFLIGHFLLTKTFVLKPNPGVYDGQARGIADHFLATYLAGLLPITLALGIFLVARTPWHGRTVAVAGGCIALAGSLVVLLPMAMSKWNASEQKTIAKLRETAYPFGAHYYSCGNWKIHAENGVHDPELWQVYLGQVKGTTGTGCNQVWVYRGWQSVAYYDLPLGDVFTGEAIVNHFDWKQPVRERGTGDIWSQNSTTGVPIAMNPMGTNVELPTANGQMVDFTLDVTSTDGFKLK